MFVRAFGTSLCLPSFIRGCTVGVHFSCLIHLISYYLYYCLYQHLLAKLCLQLSSFSVPSIAVEYSLHNCVNIPTVKICALFPQGKSLELRSKVRMVYLWCDMEIQGSRPRRHRFCLVPLTLPVIDKNMLLFRLG